MNAIFAAAKEVCDFMKARHWRFCIIGGLAVQRWGEPRLTQDADFSLLTGFGGEEMHIETLLAAFKERVSGARQLALRHRVLLLKTATGVPVDVSLAGFPYEEEIIDQATPFEFAKDIVLPTCSADDLFVMKAFAARPRDWMDAEGLVARQGKRLRRTYILNRLGQLSAAVERPELVTVARLVLEGKPWRK